MTTLNEDDMQMAGLWSQETLWQRSRARKPFERENNGDEDPL